MDIKPTADFNDKALDIMADIFEPYCKLLEDKEFMTLFASDLKKAIAYACRHHKEEVVEIAAKIDGIPVAEYKVNPFTLPIKLLATIGAYSKIAGDFFTSQVQKSENACSGLAMENTGAIDQP